METFVLRQVLISQWSSFENTPGDERQPAKEDLWLANARQLARSEDCSAAALVAELKAQALQLALRDRDRTLTELARDLAVSRALGRPVETPWKRRLGRLAGVTGMPPEAIEHQVEQRAASVKVVVQL